MHYASTAYADLRHEFITTISTLPAQLIRTPGWKSQDEAPLHEVVSDMLAGGDKSDDRWATLLLLVARCDRPDVPADLRLVAAAWIADLADDYARHHAPAMDVQALEDGALATPENCTWATPLQQARNTSATRWVEHNGEKRALSEWAEIFGLNYYTLEARFRRGWTVTAALLTPVDRRFSRV